MKNRNPERRLAVVLTAVFLIHCLTWQWPSPARGQQSVAPKRVLVLYWYNRDYLWNVEFDQSFKFRLDSAPPGSIEYYQEYLESDQFPGEPQARLLRDYLRKKYADHPIDVVVATSDASLEFLIKDRSGLFPGLPIVFVATQYPTTEPGLTGIINIATHRRTVDLALSLHPTTEQVFVVSGTLEHDKRLERLARQELQGYEGRVQITYLTDLSPAQLVQKMKSLPKRSIVLYVWEQSKNEQGKLLESVDLFALIAPHAHVPIYGMLLPLVGRGVVGGYVNTGAAAGTKIAEIVLRFATGVRAVDIPVERAPAQPIFDWRQLRRWGITENKLPRESLVRFREPTLWEQYKWRILGAVVLLLGQTMLIWGLLIQQRKRRKLYTELQRSEAYLSEAQRLTHTGTWAFYPSVPERAYWSSEFYRIFGFDPPPDQARSLPRCASSSGAWDRIHADDRARVEAALKEALQQKADFETDFRIVLPDGTEKHLHNVAHPIVDEAGDVVEMVGTSMDVTEQWRARAELQEAFEEIKRLKERLHDENLVLREQIDQVFMFEEIVGTSSALRAVLSRVSKVAPTDSTVLLTGETGTGKELVARAVHKRSPRSSRAFVSVNCAAIPPDLVASELFGHEKGAFTGALQRRLGRFELAEGGTIFLDEVGDLPAETQVALLRVLQEREFERVGGNQAIRADVRVIAATNRDLQTAIAAGTFRSDLFYRLNVFPLEIPPLRERREDIPLLVAYFIDRYAAKGGKKIRGINKNTFDLLQSYRWPGNVRELQNVIERSVIVCETENLSVDQRWLSQEPAPAQPASQPLSRRPVTEEKKLIEAALAEARGRVSGPSGAAAKLGMPASTLESKIRALKIDKYRFRTA